MGAAGTAGKNKRSKSQVNIMKTIGRVAALLLLLVTMTGPWIIDTHPATEKTCSSPLVWLGDGYCACLITYAASWVPMRANPSFWWVVWLLPMLPFLSTLVLILGRGRRFLWIFHLITWGLTALFALFFFFEIWTSHPILILWGSGFGGMMAVAMLVGEILIAKRLPNR